jgi:hypothetical protein
MIQSLSVSPALSSTNRLNWNQVACQRPLGGSRPHSGPEHAPVPAVAPACKLRGRLFPGNVDEVSFIGRIGTIRAGNIQPHLTLQDCALA